MTRQPYLDRIRWCTVLIVIVYHVLYQFNSVGLIRNIYAPGIPILDTSMAFVYPWFMALLFVVAGMSAQYAMQKRTSREFLRDRAKHILLPSVAGIFLLSWLVGWITSKGPYFVLPGEAELPDITLYLIYCLSGIGPLWFCHELFAGCLVLLLLRKLDKNNRLWHLGGKVKGPVLVLLGFAVWGSAQILNTPLIEVYRNGFYWFLFLLGYYVFSHESVTDALARHHLPLLITGCLMGVLFMVCHYGENYAAMEVLKTPFTNTYAWVMVLALLGTFKAHCNGPEGPVSRYLTERNFGFYALHNPLEVLIAYPVVTFLQLPTWCNYLLVLSGTVVLLPIFYELVSRIPLLNKLLLGK